MGYAHTVKSRRHIARLLTVAGLAVATVAIPVAPSTVHAAGLGPGGEFHPLKPQRIFDSRPASAVNDPSPGAKPLGTGPAEFNIHLLGVGGIPSDPAAVLAVVVNFTVTEPGASGYLEAYGKGAKPVDRTSIVNFVANQTVPNVAIVRPGQDGDLTIGLYGQSGTANVLVDVFGWFSTSNYQPGVGTVDPGSRLIPVTPARLLDTREGVGTANVIAPLGPKQTIELQIRGADGVNPGPVIDAVPDSPTVTGVLLNVVGITDRAGGYYTYLSLLPDAPAPGEDPTTSNLNLIPKTTKANLVFVPVGADGKVRIFNYQGQTDVVADVVGYLQSGADPNTRKGRVVPLTSPYRTLDTRSAREGGVALGPGQAEDWSFADFSSSVTIGTEQVGKQLGVIGNLTSAELSRQYSSVAVASYLTAYPGDVAKPFTSNLNTVEGRLPIPNLAVLKYSTSNNIVRVYNNAGYDHYIFDAAAVVLDD